MAQKKTTIAVIGEGITEKYYLLSLKDLYPKIDLMPKLPKHSSSMNALEISIKNCIEKGYSKIFCLIDMDNKKSEKEKSNYMKLKTRYHNKPIGKKKQGAISFVRFFETERCTELFFYYYFQYTSKFFGNSDEVVDLLNKKCGYEKKEQFFRSHSLHQYLESKKGSLSLAIQNASKSLNERKSIGMGCDYTYSELGELFKELNDIR